MRSSGILRSCGEVKGKFSKRLGHPSHAMKRKWLIPLILASVLVVLLFYPKMYVVRDEAGGTLFWNSNEALLFVGVERSGARFAPLTYFGNIIRESLGGVRPPDIEACLQTVVIRMTDKDVERYETDIQRHLTDGDCFGHIAPFEGHIYAGYLAQGRIWKWSGDHFEPAAQEELRGFDPMKAASRGFQFDDIEGWSMREYALGRVRYPLTLNGQPVTFVSSGRVPPAIYEPSVDVIRSGQNPQRIWYLDERPHRVSKAEYDKIFGDNRPKLSPQ